ncbi:MAG: DUF2191 domain-containing protein [Acidobacteriota bacterium]
MKTTVEISDPVLAEAKEIARREGSTLRALMEEGLRLALDRRDTKRGFRLRDASAGGRGLRPELRGASWDEIRDLAYRGRGG